MKQEWRRGDDPIHSYKVNYGDVKGKPVGIGALHRIPDTNKKKRDEAQDFFAQEKLLIEYWVSKSFASTSEKWIISFCPGEKGPYFMYLYNRMKVDRQCWGQKGLSKEKGPLLLQ